MRLEDLGLIGNCQYSALVERSGSVVWCCLPRFDSPPVFGRLLDPQGGDFSVAPANGSSGLQRYVENTNVLETVFDQPEGRFRILDFAPRFVQYDRIFRPTQLIRIIEPLSGNPLIRVRCEPCVGWSKEPAAVLHGSNHLRFEGLAAPLRLTSDIPITYLDGRPFALTERRHLVLAWGPPVEEALPAFCDRMLGETMRYWHRWVKHCSIPPMYQQQVIRSALALKLHCFEDTGAIVAAMTTSIPEFGGSGRTWDYRYCWLRDATVTLFALMSAGYREEAAGWIEWLLRSVAGDPAQLQIMYGMMGERLLTEIELPHLAGYEGSKPVRKGNAAAEQFQLDVFGELMDALFQARRMKIRPKDDPWPLQCHLVEFVTKHWTEPDEGIWEIRGPRRHFTHSKMMAWVAIDRAVRTIEEFGADGPLAEWRALRGRIHADICAQGYDSERGVFTQSYGAKPLDGSLLLMPLVGFLPPDDPRVVRTIEAIDRELRADGLVLRYHPDTSAKIDGLPPGEGAFLPCSFWMVDCLNLLGRREEAEERFRHLLTLCSPLGLLAEEYDPRARRQLGNFPQAYSHVGLVNSAQNLAQGPTPVGQRMDGHTIVTHSQP